MLRVTAVLALFLALGCATVLQSRKKENLLHGAGFRIVAANTPEKINALNTLPRNKISKVERAGGTYYVFPDTDECRCLYVGREEQYQRYRRMASDANETMFETTGASTQSEAFKGYEPW